MSEVTLTKAQQAKQIVIDEIGEKLEKSSSVLLVDYIGMTVAESTELRNQFRAAGVEFKVFKNTLINRAMKEKNIEPCVASLDGRLVLLAISRDTLAKQIRLYRKGADKGDAVKGFSAAKGELMRLHLSSEPPLPEEEIVGDQTRQFLRLGGSDQHADTLFLPFFQQRKDFPGPLRVQAVHGLVQHQQRRIPQEGRCDPVALLFP